MENFDEYIKDLSALVSYKSVLEKAEGDKPFGNGVYGAYKYFTDLAKSFGFNVINYDNYAGEVCFGEGEEIGIIGHLDVVPEGEGWNTPPYTLTEKGGVYYGRGVMDDKGPMLLALYALKELKESKIPVKRKFRLFVGCNEETGWKDAEYLAKKANLPEYGFSPDGNFPVSYAEKGMAIVEFKIPALKNFYGIKGGTVINAVCAKATVKAKSQIKTSLGKYGLKIKDGVIESEGKSAHGSCPEQGLNALYPLFCFLCEEGEDVQRIKEYLFEDAWGLKEITTEQGNITFSPDLIEEKDGFIYIKCDCRYPYPVKEETLKKIFDKSNSEYTLTVKHGTQYVEKDGFLVKTLLNSYDAVCGGKSAPISQGGSTFARVFKKGVAFGPELPDVKSTIHEPNERVTEEEIIKIYDIYKTAIFSLATKKE